MHGKRRPCTLGVLSDGARRLYVAGLRGVLLHAPVLLLLAALTSCNSSDPPDTPPPGTDAGQTITGRERIGWDQRATNASQLNAFRYAIYVDGSRSEMADVSCAATSTDAGFACSGRLPAMAPGAHVLELAAFSSTDGGLVEGPRSPQLRVNVVGATSPAPTAPLLAGERITTNDDVTLEASLAAEALDLTDLAITTDGRLLVAERSGTVLVQAQGAEPFRTAVSSSDGELLALAPSPDFARTGHLFVIQASEGVFRLARYRLLEQQLIERMIVLPDVRASAQPSAALRFGPDAKLYAVFDDGGSRDAAASLSAWNGKVLRINPDGSTPDDMPAASPVFWNNIAAAGGLDWSPEGAALWIAERDTDGAERLRALITSGERPRRTGQRTSYLLPPPVGASSLAFYRGDIPSLRDDLFIAARTGGYLLRVRFDETDRMRVETTEKLLQGRLGEVRAVASLPDGALLVGTETAVWQLTPIRGPK